MENYQALKARLAQEEEQPGFVRRTRPLKNIIGWLESSICSTQPKQFVVGQRKLEDGSGTVTAAMFANKERSAQVCPFVRDSLDANLFWLEECQAGRDDVAAIERRVTDMVEEFVRTEPAFDPKVERRPEGLPRPTVLKAMMVVLPNLKLLVDPEKGDEVMEGIHEKLKPIYMGRGLMLGQFYAGCPQEGVYNKAWLALNSPWPAFAARYMVRHDINFVGDHLPLYRHYFPEEPEQIARH